MRPFWFIIQGLKFYQTYHFHKMIVQNNIFKKHFQRNLVIKHKKIKKFYWDTVPIVQENQNAAKKSGCHFYSLNTP